MCPREKETQIQVQNSWTRLTGFKNCPSNLINDFLFPMIPFTPTLLTKTTSYRWFHKLLLSYLCTTFNHCNNWPWVGFLCLLIWLEGSVLDVWTSLSQCWAVSPDDNWRNCPSLARTLWTATAAWSFKVFMVGAGWCPSSFPHNY